MAASYGTWRELGDQWADTVEETIDGIFSYAAYGASGYDIAAIATDYRTVINTALPADVHLAGNQFVGPNQKADENTRQNISAIVEQVDLVDVIARHWRQHPGQN